MLAAMHDELAHRHLLSLSECVTEYRVAFVSLVAIRKQIVGLLEIAAVDLVQIDKGLHVDGVLGFEFERVKLLGLDQDMVAFGVLVALYDVFLGHLPEAVLGLNALEVFDGLSTRLMNHAKGDSAFCGSRRVKPDRDEDEGEAEIARPNRNGGHGDYSETLLTL